MSIALAVWSLELKAGEDNAREHVPPISLRITNVALGADLADEKGRTTLKLIYLPEEEDAESEENGEDHDHGDEPDRTPVETVLCTLVPGQIENATVDIVLPSDRPFVFAAIGKNTLYLTGNYIDQMEPDQPPSDDELMSDEGAVDVEEDEDEDEDEAEEEKAIPAAHQGSRKRAHEEDEHGEQLSKKQRKKLKQQQAAQEAVKAADAGAKSANQSGSSVKEESKTKKEESVLEGGVKVADLKLGTGPKAKRGDTVSVMYVGKLQNGKTFDSKTKGKPFEFHLGQGEVIKGWDVGVAGMQVGGKRLIIVPPSMGYGTKARPSIPANSTLTFDVSVVEIKS